MLTVATMGFLHNTTACVTRGVTAVMDGGRSAVAGGAANADRRYQGGRAELLRAEYLADRRAMRVAVNDELIQWLCEWGFTAFWSLTFNPAKFPGGVSATIAEHMWKRVIVENLNTELYGHNYRRNIGHSYFGYLVGIEPHKSGALHMHACTTGRTHWAKACELWQAGKNLNVGTLEIRRIGDTAHDVRYALKYAMKGGETLFYKQPDKLTAPHFEPLWYQGY